MSRRVYKKCQINNIFFFFRRKILVKSDAFLILSFKPKKITFEGTDSHYSMQFSSRGRWYKGFWGLAIRSLDRDMPFYSKVSIPRSVLLSFSGGCAYLSRNGWQEHSVIAMYDRQEVSHWLNFNISLSGHQKCTVFLRFMAVVGEN